MEESNIFQVYHTNQPHTSSSIQAYNNSATQLINSNQIQTLHGSSSHHHHHHHSDLVFPTSQTHFPFHLLPIRSEDGASIGDDVDDYKRLRRILSNRESARRSRIRKKQQIQELQSQVEQFQTVNRHLSEKLINLMEINREILQENAQLKDKVSTLQNGAF